jgi:uracil-DNA glycosylase
MDVNIESSWKEVLKDEFEKEYFKDLVTFVKKEYSSKKIFPEGEDIFRAFKLCTFNKVKVVIIGQDPYHGEKQANGLAFSVHRGVNNPPSLQNIFKELHNDLSIDIPKSGELENWAKQGVLLLNATLTVEAHRAGSHQHKGWEEFTDAIVKKLSDEKNNLVFILWGKYAQEKGKNIDINKHYIIKSAHPSPFSAHKGFFGSKPFSKTNIYLKSKNIKEINWSL